jgi:hypothetical protein
MMVDFPGRPAAMRLSSDSRREIQVALEKYLNGDEEFLKTIKGASRSRSASEFSCFHEGILSAVETVRGMVDKGASIECVIPGVGVEMVAENARSLTMMYGVAERRKVGDIPPYICPVQDLVGKLSNAKDDAEEKTRLIKGFIESGYDVNRVVIFNEFYPSTREVIQSPLLNTLIMNESATEAVAILLREGRDVIDPNLCDTQEKNALICAAKLNSTESIGLLLRANEFLTHPVDIDGVDASGRTALHYACLYGNESAVKKLVEAGARYDIKDKSGCVAEDLIASDGFRHDLHMAGVDCARDSNAHTNSEAPTKPSGVTLGEKVREDKVRLAEVFPTLIEYSVGSGVKERSR